MDILGLAPHQYVWPPHCPPNTQVLERPLGTSLFLRQCPLPPCIVILVWSFSLSFHRSEQHIQLNDSSERSKLSVLSAAEGYQHDVCWFNYQAQIAVVVEIFDRWVYTPCLCSMALLMNRFPHIHDDILRCRPNSGTVRQGKVPRHERKNSK